MPVKFPDRLRNLNIFFSVYSPICNRGTETEEHTDEYIVFFVRTILAFYANCDVRIRVYRCLMNKKLRR